MSNFAVIPSKEEDIGILLNKNVSEIIIGVRNLSIYPFEMKIEDIIEVSKKTDKNIVIAMNRMIHNLDIQNVKDVLAKIKGSKIKKILFYDLGIYKIIKDMQLDMEMILSKEHLNSSISSHNFYYKEGITSSFITSDITYNEVLEIKNSTKMHIYYTVYGYLPIFYSRRYLLTNYFKYINKEMSDKTYYIVNDDLKYMLREYSYGTIIYSPLINLINEQDSLGSIDYLVIDLSYTDDISIVDKYLNHEKIKEAYLGFYNKKTIYKLKEDK